MELRKKKGRNLKYSLQLQEKQSLNIFLEDSPLVWWQWTFLLSLEADLILGCLTKMVQLVS